MTQNRANPIVQRIGFAALFAVILAGCGGGETTTPPPPAPFRPQAITVNLGEHGGSITLMTTQAGGYTRNGQAFTSGTEVEAENGNRYRVTLTGQTWSSEFLPPEAVVVQLGTSGDTVSITRLEDRSYQADGEPLGEDRIVTADNGNMYRLTLGDSGWSWDFVPPEAVSVQLGTSGDTVSITQREDRTYLADGEPLGEDRIVTADNGNMYRLMLGDSGWSWDFVPPEAVSVQLGTSGDTVSITQQEDRSYLVDGEPLAGDGIVTADNGNMYRLTLGDSGWSWAFVPPDPVMLALGTSGDTVSITRAENGSYLVDGVLLPGNRIVTADNGNTYRLRLDIAGWSWEFVPPAPEELPLGTSETTVEITRLEDGSYRVDGRPLVSGDIVNAANGNRYRLLLRESGWEPVFEAPDPVAVSLGTSGTAVLITRAENGTYRVDGEPLADDRIVTAANGYRYRLTQGADGWSAAFAPTPFPVTLGRFGGTRTVELREDGKYWLGNTEITSGDIIRGDNQKRYRLAFQGGVWVAQHQADQITVNVDNSSQVLLLTQLEDDTYFYGNTEVQSGDHVTGDDGNEYTLTLDSATGMWSAIFRTMTVTVPLGGSGDSIKLTRQADGTYQRAGKAFVSGTVVFSEAGVGYKVELRQSGWTTRIYCVKDHPPCADVTGPDPTPNPPPKTRSDTLRTVQALPATDANAPTFKTGNETSTSKGTTLVIAGSSGSTTPQEYSIEDLLGRSQVTIARTYIDSVRTEIGKIRARIQFKVDNNVYKTGAINPHTDILGDTGEWNKLKTALAGIFGSSDQQTTAASNFLGSPPTGRGNSNLDVDEVPDVLAVIDRLLNSISTLAKFEAEVYPDLVTTDGSRLTTPSAEKLYEASHSKFRFASSSKTRFAAYAIQQNGGSLATTATWDVGAFAYSPLGVSTRAMIPNRGEAEFNGDTIAIQAGATETADTKLLSGDIQLRVRFGSGRVLGLITNLRDEDNKAWTYNNKAVESIRLPIGEMASGDPGHATFTASGNSDLRFLADTPSSTFQGKFVGDAADEADAVLGTWTIAEVSGVQGAVSGAFGAAYTRTRRATKPPGESSPRGSRSMTSIDAAPDAMGKIDLGRFQDLVASSLYSRGTSILRSTDSSLTISPALGQDESLKLTVRFRRTDYTRYGVWEQELTAADDTVTVQQGVFAYSHMKPTVFSTEPDSDHVYPQNITATYSGNTIAQDRADDPKTYSGTIAVTVSWKSGFSSAVIDSAVIRNLSSGGSYFAVEGQAVDRISMTQSVSFAGQSDGIRFTSSTSTGMEVWYRDTLLSRSRLGGSHNGNFVGLSLDGPVALFGKWSVTSSGNTLIQGTYGAELRP